MKIEEQEGCDQDFQPEEGYAVDGVVWGCLIILAVFGMGIAVLAFGGLLVRLAGL